VARETGYQVRPDDPNDRRLNRFHLVRALLGHGRVPALNWLGWKPSVSWTWIFSAPDAGRDKCLKCEVERRYHSVSKNGHLFVEKETK
jgi:hypothetical protein